MTKWFVAVRRKKEKSQMAFLTGMGVSEDQAQLLIIESATSGGAIQLYFEENKCLAIDNPRGPWESYEGRTDQLYDTEDAAAQAEAKKGKSGSVFLVLEYKPVAMSRRDKQTGELLRVQ